VSRIGEIRRRLEATVEAIEALDADLAAGRLDDDEHRRGRAEQEREAGRLFASLRQAQRAADPRRTEPPREAAARPVGWLRSPPVIAALGLLLVVAGAGAGLLGARWLGGPRGAVVAREDTPIPDLLRLAHVALDEGRLDEARQTYGRVLAREARNVEAITHLGAVLYQEGRVDEALAKVEEALRLDPTYIHAHWDRTQYLFHGKQDFTATVAAAEAFLRVMPQGPDADTVRGLMAKAREQDGKR